MIAQDVPAEVRQDPAALYASAVADRRAGRPAEAETKLRRVLAARPDDADARLQLGLALLDLGRVAEGEAELLRVIAAAPDYVDAHLALARAAQARGDRSEAAARLSEAARLAPDRPDVRRAMGAAAPPPTRRVDLDFGQSRLSGGLSDWTEARLALSQSVDERWTVSGAVERTERFDQADVYLEGRLDRRFADGGAYLALGGAPDADHRARWAVRGGGAWSVGAGVAATLDGSVARFPAGEVWSLQPGAAVELADGRVTLAARWINVWDENGDRADGHAATIIWAAGDRLRLRLDHADAPETSEGTVVEVESLGVSVEWAVTERASLRVGFLDEDRGAYDRQAVSLGLGWRFQ